MKQSQNDLILSILNKIMEEELKNGNNLLSSIEILYIVFKAKMEKISLDLPTKEIVTKIFLNNKVPHTVQIFSFHKLNLFENITISDIKTFVLDSYKSIIFAESKRVVSQTTMPRGISKLLTELLDINNSDEVVVTGSDISHDLSLQLAELYPSSNFTVFYNHEKLNELFSMIAEILDYKIKYNLQDFFRIDKKFHVKTIFCIPTWGAKTENTSMEKFIQEKGYEFHITRSEDAYILKTLEMLSEDGIAILCVPFGILHRQNNPVLTYLIDNKHISSVIVLAQGLFPIGQVKTALLIISKKANPNIRLVNASEFYSKNRKLCNEITGTDIMDIFNAYTNDSKYATTVSNERIANNFYSLNPTEYLQNPVIKIQGLPDNMKFVKLSEILANKPIRGVLIKSEILDKKVNNANFYYLTQKNIIDNQISVELQSIPEQYNKIKYCLNENDIVLSFIMSDIIKVAIAQNIGDQKILVSNMLYKLTPNTQKIHPVYLKMILENEETVKILKAYASGLGATTTLSIQTLCDIQIPLPPMKMQAEIVAKYEQLQEHKRILMEELKNIENSKRLLFVTSFQKR